MRRLLNKLFSGHSLKPFFAAVEAINALEEEIAKLTDGELLEESKKLKEQAREEGELPQELVARGFALAREAARRTLGQRPFDVQLVGGLVLYKGAVAEMSTGEGKTLAAVAPAYLRALSGKGMHVVTVNEYLARRDAVWMGQIYRALGLSVSCLVPSGAFLYDPDYVPRTGADDTPTNAEGSQRKSVSQSLPAGRQERESALLDKERDTTGSFLVQQEYLRPISRREAYLADVTYGTNHEFGFDYLRDNLCYRLEDQVQRGHHFAIIDEVDSILIDEARTPLIISAPDTQSSENYKVFSRIAGRLAPETDYTVDEKFRAVSITEEGLKKVEQAIGVKDLYAPENMRLVHYLEESLKAHAIYHRDKQYVVKNGEIIIVDEFTGRLLHGRRYTAGLHQAIEAKEGVAVKEESRTYAKISIQNYFRMYEKISGMTGTAQTSAEEFFKVYQLEVMTIPTNRPLVRRDMPDVIYKDMDAKLKALATDVKARHEKGQPVLLGTTSIAKNELVSAYLSKAGIPHEVLNAKNNEREGAIIAQAGKRGAVTVATNMAGRGVDIILGGNPPSAEDAQKVKEAGGLHVVGTERHEARRIDNQLRGRSGRQGDPGSSQFFLSLDDDLLRIFGGERIKGMIEHFNLPEDQPIAVGFVSKAVAEAQAKVEGANFDVRKHLLEYDDVLNKQRSAVYAKRKEILESMNKETLAGIVFDAAYVSLEKLYQAAPLPESESEDSEMAPEERIKLVLAEAKIIDGRNANAANDEEVDLEKVKDILTKRSVEAAADPMTINRLLGVLDFLWMNHLEDLEALSESIGLRAYGQKDPLVEYRRESSRAYKDFWSRFNEWVCMNVFRLAEKPRTDADDTRTNADNRRVAIVAPPRQSASSPRQSAPTDKVGRNDPCPCGSGKKYKRCHGA
jgi:preprotein translocase subunit SecA